MLIQPRIGVVAVGAGGRKRAVERGAVGGALRLCRGGEERDDDQCAGGDGERYREQAREQGGHTGSFRMLFWSGQPELIAPYANDIDLGDQRARARDIFATLAAAIPAGRAFALESRLSRRFEPACGRVTNTAKAVWFERPANPISRRWSGFLLPVRCLRFRRHHRRYRRRAKRAHGRPQRRGGRRPARAIRRRRCRSPAGARSPTTSWPTKPTARSTRSAPTRS